MMKLALAVLLAATQVRAAVLPVPVRVAPVGIGRPVLTPALPRELKMSRPLTAPRALPAPPKTPFFMVPAPGLTDEQLHAIAQISDLLKQTHVDDVDVNKLYYGAIKGMAASLDPHTHFFDPQEFKEFTEQLKGEFAGVGIVLSEKDGLMSVMYTMPGSPAAAAGVQSGEKILAIDGKSVQGLGREKTVELIRGAAGSAITLKLGGPSGERELTLTRAVIHQPNTRAELLPGGKGYVHLTQFQHDSAQEVLAHVRALKARGATSVILDVRFNPGGELGAVAEMSAAFLKKGQTIVTMRARQGQSKVIKAPIDGEFADMPVTVLANGHSASASEILAGALQDHKRARVIGARTYGKGSAQSVIPFQDGSGIKITMQKWFTPSGKSIQSEKDGTGGVLPDVEVKVSEEDEAKVAGNMMTRISGQPGDPNVKDAVLEEALK
jgi:carboxyl-terminal processing protease